MDRYLYLVLLLKSEDRRLYLCSPSESIVRQAIAPNLGRWLHLTGQFSLLSGRA
ncbi:hypothetical protein QUB61_31410 [Microcoleus sp. C2D2]